MRFQEKPSLLFIFDCATASRENLMRMAVLLSDYFASKMKLADAYMIVRSIKL